MHFEPLAFELVLRKWKKKWRTCFLIDDLIGYHKFKPFFSILQVHVLQVQLKLKLNFIHKIFYSFEMFNMKIQITPAH